ncbi:MAG TPA: TIGR02996 domain-containing protein [Urbifossiella sp.]|nr:TIGR02996 domain-containing protein [Urbifossiella sp.]
MTNREALMRAIRDNPDDDTPRLVYADWLDDHARGPADRARARFIRLQCDAERLPEADPRRAAAQRQAADLQADHGRDWLAALADLGWPEPEELTFSRGFVADLPVLTHEFDFAAVADGFLRWEHVDGVTLAGPPARVTAAAAHPGLGLVGSVCVNGRADGDGFPAGAGDATVAALAAVPRVTPLRTFLATHAGLTDAALALLTTAPAFRDLHRLTLERVEVTPDGLTRFRGAGFARGLRHVSVDQRPFAWPPADRGREVAAAFAAGGYDSLTTLCLAGHALGDDGLLTLTASSLARRLTHFRLQGDRNLVGPGVAALFDRARWPALTVLDLMPVHVAEADLAPLVSSDRFATLDKFSVFLMDGTPDSAARLAANPHVARLRTLELTGGRLGDAGARALLGSPHLSGLRRLGLNGPGISDDTLRALADPATLPGLRELSLTYHVPLTPELRAALRRRFRGGLELDD